MNKFFLLKKQIAVKLKDIAYLLITYFVSIGRYRQQIFEDNAVLLEVIAFTLMYNTITLSTQLSNTQSVLF